MSNNAPSCRRVELLINRHLDREIEASEARELDVHAHACLECEREFKVARIIEEAIPALEIPDSALARRRTRVRVERLLAERGALMGPGLQIASIGALDDTTRRTISQDARALERTHESHFSLLATLGWVASAAIVLVGVFWMGFSWRDDTRHVEVPSSMIREVAASRFGDRMSIYENLNQDLIQVAAQVPDSGQTRPYESLIENLLGALEFYERDSAVRQEVAESLILAVRETILPAIEKGWRPSGESALLKLESWRQKLALLNHDSDSSLTAAQAILAHALDLLNGRISHAPLISAPPPGRSFVSKLSSAAVVMARETNALKRIHVMNDVWEGGLQDVRDQRYLPKDVVRWHRILADLSMYGMQPEFKKALESVGEAGSRMEIRNIYRKQWADLREFIGQSKLPASQQTLITPLWDQTMTGFAGLFRMFNEPQEEADVPWQSDATAKPVLPYTRINPSARTGELVRDDNGSTTKVLESAPARQDLIPAMPVIELKIEAPDRPQILEFIERPVGVERPEQPGSPIEKRERPDDRRPDVSDRIPDLERPDHPVGVFRDNAVEKPETPSRPVRPEGLSTDHRLEKSEHPKRPDGLPIEGRAESAKQGKDRVQRSGEKSVDRPERAKRPEEPERLEKPERVAGPEKPELEVPHLELQDNLERPDRIEERPDVSPSERPENAEIDKDKEKEEVNTGGTGKPETKKPETDDQKGKEVETPTGNAPEAPNGAIPESRPEKEIDPDQTGKPDKSLDDQKDGADKGDKPSELNGPSRPDRPVKPEREDRPNRPDRADKTKRPERERPEKPRRPSRN